MDTLHRVSNSIWFWRIIFFMMAFVAFGIYMGQTVKVETKVIIKREYIYLLYDHAPDNRPSTETRWM